MLGRGSLQITLNSAHLLLPHHAVASSKGNAPAWAGAAARYRTRPPSRGIGRSATSGNAGGDSGIHDYPRAVLRPMRGRGQGAAPGANARRSLHKPLPHLSLSSASRRQAQCVPRAPCLQGPGHERTETQKQAGQRLRDRTVRLLHLLIPNSCRTHQTSHLGS